MNMLQPGYTRTFVRAGCFADNLYAYWSPSAATSRHQASQRREVHRFSQPKLADRCSGPRILVCGPSR